jgi:PAS domain S-box-containing protein
MSISSSHGSALPHPLNHGHKHNVQLYVDDRHLVDVMGRYIGRSLAAGERGVVVATPKHRDGLTQQLVQQGFDLEGLTRQGRYTEFDAADTLSLFMAGGHIDDQHFHAGAQALLDEINRSGEDGPPGTRTCLFGEAVGLLWAAGKPEDALRFETLWNRVAEGEPISVLCAYPIMGFYSENDIEMFLRICSEHLQVSLSDKAHSDIALRANFKLRQDHPREDLTFHEAQLRFQQLVDAVKERSVFMIDTEGKISTWNTGAESIHGYAANEVIGRHISFLDEEENRSHETFKSKLATAVKRGSFVDECWRTRKDGSRFFATITITPARNESGDLIGYAETTRLSRTIH